MEVIKMDEFENYLLDKIIDFKNRIEENEMNLKDEEVHKSVSFMLNNVTDQLLEVLAEYTLNYKTLS